MKKEKIYKVGDLYTTPDSKVTGKIKEINVISSHNVRLLLEYEGEEFWSTWSPEPN